MKYTTVKISEILKHPTKRMDAKYWIKKKLKKEKSLKLQAASLTSRILNDKVKTMNEKQLKRIADAMEEILRLVKKDMENINKAAKE